MTRDSIRSATPADDAALRQLLRETPLPGNITATLEREPSFFGGEVDCLHHEAAISYRGGHPAVCGSRILRRAWWNGQPADTAYLAHLRVLPVLRLVHRLLALAAACHGAGAHGLLRKA